MSLNMRPLRILTSPNCYLSFCMIDITLMASTDVSLWDCISAPTVASDLFTTCSGCCNLPPSQHFFDCFFALMSVRRLLVGI